MGRSVASAWRLQAFAATLLLGNVCIQALVHEAVPVVQAGEKGGIKGLCSKGSIAGGQGLAFLAPAADLRLRRSSDASANMCGLKMQQRQLDNEAEAADADKLRVVGESMGGVKIIGDHDSKGLGPEAEEITGSEGVVSRRSALGIGLGLLLGPIIPIVTTALTGQPAAHAAPKNEPTSPSVSGAANKAPFVQKSLKEVLKNAGAKALGGGRSGAAAGVLQVISLMWLRTTMNYQYRYGGTTTEVMNKLYSEGGIGRFYRGLGFALVQQPLSRFGDTAANAGMVVLLDSLEATRDLPVFVKTLSASAAATLWRICLMPVDSFKTTLQVEGKDGIEILMKKIERKGLGVLYAGSAATVGSTFVGHYPWFATFNSLQASVPQIGDGLAAKLVRNAAIGLCASAVSDCCSNSFRVVKTVKQTATEDVSYTEAIKGILNTDGIQGLFGRGLSTRLVTNGLQGMLFSVVWKLFDEYWK